MPLEVRRDQLLAALGTSVLWLALCVSPAEPRPVLGGPWTGRARHLVPLAPRTHAEPNTQSLGHPTHQRVRELQAPAIPPGAGEAGGPQRQGRGSSSQGTSPKPSSCRRRSSRTSNPWVESSTASRALAWMRSRAACSLSTSSRGGYS